MPAGRRKSEMDLQIAMTSPSVVLSTGPPSSPERRPRLTEEQIARLQPTDVRRLLGRPARVPAIRQSVMGDLLRCPRMFLLRHRMGLDRTFYAEPITQGSLFHVYMEHLYSGHDWSTSQAAAARRTEEYREELLSFMDTHPDSDCTWVDRAIRQLEKDFAVATAMARYYYECYPPHPDWECVETELEITARVSLDGRQPISLGGRLDMLLFDRGARLAPTPGYYILDYKTVDASRDLYETALIRSFSGQSRLYRWLAGLWLKQQGRAEPLLGMIHCFIRRPSIRPCRKDCDLVDGRPSGEPVLENYIRRVRDWYMGTGEYSTYDAARRTSPPAIRSVTMFTGPVPDPELVHQISQAIRYARALPVLGNYPRNSAACQAYGRTCQYLDLCSAPPAHWREILMHSPLTFDEDSVSSSKQDDTNGDTRT